MQEMRHLEGDAWRKSSYSSSGGNCVEVAITSAAVGLRDSKSRDAGVVTLPRTSWTGFLDTLK